MPAGWNQTSGSFREGEDYSLFVSYENLFGKFAENYWNLVTKYHLKQMLPDGKSEYSKIEQIYALGYDIPNHYE